MLEQVNSVFGITPVHDLGLMKPGQGLNELVSRALAGFHHGGKVIHLEAGLRTGDISSPLPEEANRRIIGQVAALHLAPTEDAMENLRKENFRSKDIVVTGNTVIDALLEAAGWDTEFADPALQAAIANLFCLGERLPDFAPSAAD